MATAISRCRLFSTPKRKRRMAISAPSGGLLLLAARAAGATASARVRAAMNLSICVFPSASVAKAKHEFAQELKLFQMLVQPGPGELPVAPHAGEVDAENAGCLLVRIAAEETKLDDARRLGV